MKHRTIIFSLFLVGIMAILINSPGKSTIKHGSILPLLIYEGKTGMNKIERENNKTTVIVWFHPNCGHCLYQLNVFNDNINAFNETRLFFLTESRIFPQKKHLGKWQNLTSAVNVKFGITSRDVFCDLFGPVVNPSIFIFDKAGVLISKIYGEVKLEKLLELINHNIVPEQDRAVLNNALTAGESDI